MGEKEVISRRGLSKKHGALDLEVWQWKTGIEISRKIRVSKSEVQAHALKIYKSAGINSFKASDGWYRRWRQRWQSSDTIQNNVHKKNAIVKMENEAALKEPSRKRRGKAFDAEFLATEEIKDCVESHVEVKNTLDDPQIKGSQDTIPSSLISQAMESQLNSKGDTSEVLEDLVKNTIPAENPPTSGFNSLVLSVNFLESKESRCPKRLKLSHKDIKQPLKTNSIYGFLTSTEVRRGSSISESNFIDKTEPTREGFNELGKNTFVEFQKNPIFKSSENNVVLVENENCEQKTLMLVESTIKDNMWTFINDGEGDICLTTDNSQVDSGGITSSFILSPACETSEIDFGENEDELFCDSCDDFHPRQKCSHSSRKQKKEVRNSFLLSSVFEKQESIATMGLSHLNFVCDKNTPKNNSDPWESQLQNPSVLAPKGKRYLVKFKSKVVNYALNHTVKKAAEEFKVNRNTVAEWMAERKRFTTKVPVKYVDKDAAGDSAFLEWLEHSKFNLTTELVKQKALEWLRLNENVSLPCQWLWMYANRLNGTKDDVGKKRYIVYPEAFKRAVVFHAQTHSNLAASRVFGVARKRVIEWQQHSGDLKAASKYTGQSNVTDETVDVKVYEWYCQQNPTPTSLQVRNKAVELYRAAGHVGIQCKAQWYYRWRARHKLPPPREQLHSDFTPLLIWTLSQLDNNKHVSQNCLAAHASLLSQKKFSRGWTFRFCKRFSSLLQALPAPDTPLPSLLEQKVLEYKRALHDLISSLGVAQDRIMALDEIPLHFLSKDKTKKPLLVRRPGFESCQATLMISCFSDGTLLPTVFVFKGLGPDSGNCDPRVISHVNDSGSITDDTMQQWLSSVCFPNLSGGGVLVMDSFDVHVTPEVVQSVTSHNVHCAVTPPGCAFKLLPITPYCLTFKAMIEDMCQTWLASQTAALESPSPDMLYQWAVRAHKHMAKHYKEKIQLAFKNMLLPK